MTAKKITSICIKLLFVTILLAGCTFPATDSDDIEVHFGRPSGGDVIMLGESFDLLANGSSTGVVSRVLFFADGRLVGESRNGAGETIVASYRWTPPETGLYTLQLAAQRGSAYVYSETITVCVLPFQIAEGHPADIYAHGYEGDCAIPERDPAAVPGAPSVSTLSVSPETLTYVPLYYDLCPDQTRFLNFKFYIDDPNDDIVFTAIALAVDPAYFGRISGETTLALTQVGETPPHRKLFAGGIDMHIFLERSLVNPDTGEGESGEIRWFGRAFGRDGSLLMEEGPFTIPVEPASCDGTLSTSTPTSLSTEVFTATPASQETATPASAIDCPPGTYFSEFTNKCYAIAVPTETPKGNNSETPGGGNSCSQYTSANACAAAGCTYNFNTKSCE